MGAGRRSLFRSHSSGIPHHCSVGLDALDGFPVKVHQQCLWNLGLFQLPEEKQSLLGLLTSCEVLEVHVSCLNKVTFHLITMFFCDQVFVDFLNVSMEGEITN